MTDLIKRDPFRSLFTWPRWLDEFDESYISQRGLKIRETDKNIVLEAVIAGVPANQVDIDIEDGVVTIKATSKEEQSAKDEYRSSTYQYYYTCALSGGLWNKAVAEVKHGVLTLTIPKAETAKKQKVKVKTLDK